MFELTIDGAVYGFNFGFGFYRDIDKTVIGKADQNGVSSKMGLQYKIARIVDLDPDAIVDVLDCANKYAGDGYSRLTRSAIEGYVQSDSCDIEELAGKLLDFFRMNNTTKGAMRVIDRIRNMSDEEKEKILAGSR